MKYLFFAALLGAAASVQAQPQGKVTRGVLPPGKFYPGTPHDYAVYVPAQYDSSRPTAWMVFLDGNGALRGLHVPAVLDDLIEKRELPPIIGIFVNPGVLPAVSPNAQNRYERIFEYDSVTDRFSRFLLEELIPTVGKSYRLSDDPDLHAIAGESTGAVGAFVAAWERPDQFHRVLSLIGTFVDMKGAEELASLVRKTEPKPIRVWMQDGKNDHMAPGQPWGVFYAGSWPINNEVMYEALQFAGYDVRFSLGGGGHDGRQGAAEMPESLRWLWGGAQPKPVVVHEAESEKLPGYMARGRVYSIVSADRPWERVYSGKGPLMSATSDANGAVYFADSGEHQIERTGPGATTSAVRADGGMSEFWHSGRVVVRCAPDGSLWVATPNDSRITVYDSAGKERALVGRVRAHDLVFASTGAAFVEESMMPKVDYVAPDGRVLESSRINSFGLGIALTPDEAMLIESPAGGRYAWSYQIGVNHSVVNGEPYYRLYEPELPRTAFSETGGVATDVSGQVYFATAMGIQVTEQNGRVSAILNPPEVGSISSLTFAGPNHSWLYVTEGNNLYRRPTKVEGAGFWKKVKPPKPPL